MPLVSILRIMPGFYTSLPILFIKFWYLEAPIRLLKFFLDFNHTVLQFLSLPLLIRTFFKPLKNEYRKGLVGFSIGFGILVKSTFIFIDLILIGFLVALEVLIFTLFVLWPFLTITILFI